MKCPRCSSTFEKSKDGWVNCPKCGLSRFVGDIKPAKKKPENGEAPEAPEPKAPEPEEEPEEEKEE